MNATKIGWAVGALLATIGAAQAQAVLKVGYPYTNVPFASLPNATPANYTTLDPQGTLAQGAQVDLMAAVAKDAGLKVQFVPLTVADALSSLTTGKVDAFLRLGITPERKQQIDFSEPVDTDSDGLLIKKTDATPYKSWDELKGQVIGTTAGTVLADAIKAASGTFAEVKTYPTGPELYQAVSAGQVKAGFTPSIWSTTLTLQQSQFSDLQIVKSYQPKVPLSFGIAVRMDEGDLLKKINVSLAKLKADGTAKAIYVKYGVGDSLAK